MDLPEEPRMGPAAPRMQACDCCGKDAAGDLCGECAVLDEDQQPVPELRKPSKSTSTQRCENCDKNLAQILVLEFHKYYRHGDGPEIPGTCDRDARKDLCFDCAEKVMEWDNGDLDNDRATSTLGRDEPAPPAAPPTLKSFRFCEPCNKCGKNFYQVRVVTETTTVLNSRELFSRQDQYQRLCIACSGLAPNGWTVPKDLPPDFAIPENWEENKAKWNAEEKHELPF